MDKKQIVEILKAEGVVIAEDMALQTVRGAIALIRALTPQLSMGFSVAINAFLGAYEKQIYTLIDKIDGKDNPNY